VQKSPQRWNAGRRSTEQRVCEKVESCLKSIRTSHKALTAGQKIEELSEADRGRYSNKKVSLYLENHFPFTDKKVRRRDPWDHINEQTAAEVWAFNPKFSEGKLLRLQRVPRDLMGGGG